MGALHEHLCLSRPKTPTRPAAPQFVRLLGSGSQAWWRMVSSADHDSPLNAGIMLIRPSTDLFAAGLRVIGRCRYNRTHGWELVGPPSTLPLRFRHTDGSPVEKDVADHPATTLAFKQDSWHFAGADYDQGLCACLLRLRSE